MEEILRELTEFELDAVAGGNPFGIIVNAAFSEVDARIRADLDVSQANLADQQNLFNISGP